MPARYHLTFIALIIAATFLVYCDSFNNSFVHDDIAFIVDNQAIRTLNPKSITGYFLDRNSSSSLERLSAHVWRPLVTTSFAVDYRLWGLSPRFYHMENTAFHSLNAVLVYLLTFLILGNGAAALVAALVFAVHPVQTEAVTWASGRSNVLFAAFFLPALIFHIRNRMYGPSRLNYNLALIFFTLGLLSKEAAVVLPLVMILYDLHFYRSKGIKEGVRYYSAFFLTAAFYILARFSVLGRVGQIEIPWKGRTTANILTILKAMCGYIRLIFIPTNLRADYYMEKAMSVREADALIAVSVLSFVVLSWFVLRRKRAVSFYILWFFVTLAPVCNIVPINAIMAERFLYLPMIGFASLFAMFFSRLMDRSRHNSFFGAAAISVLAAILILYGFAAISRNFEWRRPLVFYAKEVERSPSNPIAHNNLGLVYAKEAREGGIPDGMRAAYRALAEAQYKEAMALDGAYAAPARNLANLCREAGRHSLAIENFKKAVSMEDDAVSYNNMAVSYYCLGEFDETIPACKKALALRPDYADAYINLGNAFFMKGDYRRAKAAWSAAARLGGATPEALEGIKDLALKGY